MATIIDGLPYPTGFDRTKKIESVGINISNINPDKDESGWIIKETTPNGAGERRTDQWSSSGNFARQVFDTSELSEINIGNYNFGAITDDNFLTEKWRSYLLGRYG